MKREDDNVKPAGFVRHILVVNLGSSSGKFSLFDLNDAGCTVEHPVWTNVVELDFEAGEDLFMRSVCEALEPLSSKYGRSQGSLSIEAVGNRIVHGGSIYTSSVMITENVKADIERFEKYAPIHNKLNLAGIQAVENLFGASIKQAAVFDTAFHHTLPEVAARYAVPDHWLEQYGLRRYGFHGISHQYASLRAAEMLGIDPGQFSGIICHLGSGCSVTAVQNGKSIDTSMGFTPLEGLVMGTRSGSVDPGILLHLLREQNMTVAELSHALNYESGLAGISGLPNDMRIITKEALQGNERAKLAIEIFVYRLQSFIGAYYVHLKEPKALVFTGGIGEHSSEIRERTVAALGSMGFVISQDLNRKATADADVSGESTRARILVIKSCEELLIARETAKLVQIGLPHN